MPEPVSSSDFLQRLQQGEQDAVELLFTRYASRLARVAEQHLSHRLAARLDGEDVVQSVFRTFVRRCREGGFRLDGPGQLWRLLLVITQRKARAAGRHHTAGVRGVQA